ncbi:unnamed protein product [Rotaria magnacalcarata]|nr:unnamed protein product [Rotaria magnacalcarata]CAF3815995.1 unnamed protein product [Rotaria magnacalcarata]
MKFFFLFFKKLSKAEVLYLFLGVNQRFTRLVNESIFPNRLTLTKGFADGAFDRLDNQKLGRFFLQILSSIRHKIEWLSVEASSMEDILLCTSYPNLYGLGLHDETPLTRLLQNKITSLVIDTILYEDTFTEGAKRADVFACILILFSKLECLHYGSSYWDQPLFQIPPTISSSTLLELHVILETFTDCLYLLDGRFNSLQKLFVDVCRIVSPLIIIDNQLYSERDTDKYNELIVPLIYRMTNLEELNLHLVVYCEKRFIDGYDLKRNIAYLSSNEDCQRSFNGLKNNKIISCVDYFPECKEGQYHMYSYPYPATYYEYITDNFPDGLFKYVREISLYDERPFEHEFFIKIAKSFPLMEKLTVYNNKPEMNKFDERSKVDNRHLSVIQYPYLRLLDLFDAHDDYAEQFLLEFKTCLPIKLDLYVYISTLSRVTHNFTRNATRMNCAKINDAVVPGGKPSTSKQLLKDYMSDAKIICSNSVE